MFTPMTYSKRNIILFSFLCVMTFLLEMTDVDFYIQDFFYDKIHHSWIVDGANPWLRFLFYNLPKYIIGCFGAIILGFFLYASCLQKQWSIREKRLLCVILSLVFIPLTISVFKELTHIHCPSRLKNYGGPSDFQGLMHLFSKADPLDRGKCFPAGHASGGFALMSLYVFGRTYCEKWSYLSIGLVMGWIMALYQMMKGAHFLSHSCMTMLLSWVMIVGFSSLLHCNQNK